MNPCRCYQITSSRLRLNIVEWGPEDAPPLLLQHGGRDHSRSWDAVAGAFAGDFRVIAPDLRGHGHSEWANDGDYHTVDMVHDMKAIFETLQLPPCCVVGHSLGGYVATRFAGLFPELVTKLVNIEGLALSAHVTPNEDPLLQLEQLREWMLSHAKTAGRAPKVYPDLATAVVRMRETNHRLPATLARHLVVQGTTVHGDGSVSFRYDPGLMAMAPVDMSPAGRRAINEAINCPVLVVYGTESWMGSPEDDGPIGQFSNARLLMFERAGHWVHHDRQSDFIVTLQRFLAG